MNTPNPQTANTPKAYMGLLLSLVALLLLQINYVSALSDHAFIATQNVENLVVHGRLCANDVSTCSEQYESLLWSILQIPSLLTNLDMAYFFWLSGLLIGSSLVVLVWKNGNGQLLAPGLLLIYPPFAFEGVIGTPSFLVALLLTLCLYDQKRFQEED